MEYVYAMPMLDSARTNERQFAQLTMIDFTDELISLSAHTDIKKYKRIY